MGWFTDIIPEWDRLETVKARLDLNIHLMWLRRLLPSIIDRLEAIG